MRRIERWMRHWLAGLGCLTLVFPLVAAGGVPAVPPGGSPAGSDGGGPFWKVGDVELAADGTLCGVVIDVDGGPVPGVWVVVMAGSREAGRGQTDGLGRFRVAVPGGGTYAIQAAGGGQLVRAWVAGTAPPTAKPWALVVVGKEVVRGQIPLERFWSPDVLVVGALVAAAIATPLSMHNSGPPASP